MKWVVCLLLCTSCGGPLAPPNDASVDARRRDGGAGSDAQIPCIEYVGWGCSTRPDASAPGCVTDLSGVGTGDFRISFTLTTTWTSSTDVYLALVGQKAGCDQTSPAWYVMLSESGNIIGGTINGMYIEARTGNSINNGAPHRVVVSRVGGLLSCEIDGTPTSAAVPDPHVLDTLPPLVVGTSECLGWAPLAGHGTLTDLCVTK